MPNPTAGNFFRPIDDPVMQGVAASAVTPVAICFHPADEPTAAAPVDMCFHPARPGGDLATDLHRALTGADERDLAALAGRP